MIKIIKGVLYLVPSLIAVALIVHIAANDSTLGTILFYILYGFISIFVIAVGLLVLLVLWQFTKTGLFLVFGIKLNNKSASTTTE